MNVLSAKKRLNCIPVNVQFHCVLVFYMQCASESIDDQPTDQLTIIHYNVQKCIFAVYSNMRLHLPIAWLLTAA